MHLWGEEGFDWKGLDDAINIIDKELRFWRIDVRQSKEKYGTARIYCSLGWTCLLNITHPGYFHYGPYPKWLRNLDIFYLSNIVHRFNWLVVPIHKWAYKRAYKKAVDKYPELINEICCMADYVELLDFYLDKRKEYDNGSG